MNVDPAYDAKSPAGHLPFPDYTRPVLSVPEAARSRMLDRLTRIYGESFGQAAYAEVERLMKVYYAHKRPELIAAEKNYQPEKRFSEQDVILITYGDMIQGTDNAPLMELFRFAETFLTETFNTLHILPFFPYSSDRGFAIKDFKQVEPRLGDWSHITRIKSRFNLMGDLVLNHVSSEHHWFLEFLNAHPDFMDFFITFPDEDAITPDQLKKIVRPRTSKLLSAFAALDGKKAVWTTFSRDQIDLNYKHWPVLCRMIDILLFYVRHGADIVRLDAVTYLWKELGTSCVHLDENHLVVKLFRDILDAVAPHVAIITETNVPHSENISYFGDGRDEAQMVYNFALPPLLLYTFLAGSAEKLTGWARQIEKISDTATFFNFMDSHDGLGLRGAREILNDDDIAMMCRTVTDRGGLISYKDNGDGTTSPYELNITCYSALNDNARNEPEWLKIKRYLATRAIPLILAGVPGIYLHGLLGSQNAIEAVESDGIARSINRQTLDATRLYETLQDQGSLTAKIFQAFSDLIIKRRQHPAFHPNSGQQVLNLSHRLFAVVRSTGEKTGTLICLINVTETDFEFDLDLSAGNLPDCGRADRFTDLLSNAGYPVRSDILRLSFAPYAVLWLKPE